MTKRDNEYNVPLRLPIPGEDTEAMFRRLVAFSYAIGRQYRADGGTAEIEDAIRTARSVGDQRAMSHIDGGPGVIEKQDVKVREPLSGYEMTVGRFPKQTAPAIEGALQTASEIAPYFTPAAPVAAARDIAVGLREGNMDDLAMSALGIPGKIGRAAKAAAAGAYALAPDKAEAGSLRKAIEIARQMVERAPESDKMGVFHTLYQSRLPQLKEIGSIPAPSLAITRPDLVPTSFGDTLLVGRAHLAVPSEKNKVFGSDIYSPRFPRTYIEDGKTYIATPAGGQKIPATAENIIANMEKSPLRGGEENNESHIGTLIAKTAPEYKTLEDIVKARGKLAEDSRDHYSSFDDLGSRVLGSGVLLSQHHVNPEMAKSNPKGSYIDALNAYIERGLPGFAEHYRDPEKFEIHAIGALNSARSVRPDYFEAKPMRPVGFNEFAGALIGRDKHGTMAAERLEDIGFPASSIYRSNIDHPYEYSRDIYKNFGEHLFSEGGEVSGAVVPEELMKEYAPRLKNLGVREVVPFNPELTGSQQKALREFIGMHFNEGGSVGRDYLGKGGVISEAVSKLLSNLKKQRPDEMRRAKEMGYDTKNIYFHGTDQPIDEFNPNVYVAKDPSIAEVYARKREYEPVQLDLFKPNPAPNIIPMFAKKGSVEMTNPISSYYKVFDPTNLRSVFADFNPEHANSADLMKSGGGSVINDALDVVYGLPRAAEAETSA